MATMQRWSMYAQLVLAALLVAGGTACKGDSSPGQGAKEAATVSSGATGEDEALLQRRDALMSSRRKLRERRRELAEERRRVVESGGDPTEVDQKAAELSREEEELGAREVELEQDFEALLSQQRAIMASIASQGDDGAQMAAREASLAGRERSLGTRESRLADREAALAERERTLAARERETCGVAAAPTIIQAAAPEGTKYRRKDVEPLLQKARKAMSRRGILASDLPGPARTLEDDATKAMEKGDYGQARFAAAQLLATVEGMKIDKTFIQAKIRWLSAAMKGTKLDAGAQGKVDALFKQATADYGDAKFESANKRLNDIYALIRGA